MAEISVFECGICSQRYNAAERLPLSLPCGHVYCKPCMKSMSIGESFKCPADNQVQKAGVERLPVRSASATILSGG